MNDWVKSAPVAVTVCDASGRITEMNDKAAKVFEKSGGSALVGKNLSGCHSERSNAALAGMLSSRTPVYNAYTIEKNGVKKLICQFSSVRDGEPAGLVELSIELPAGMPHHVRK